MEIHNVVDIHDDGRDLYVITISGAKIRLPISNYKYKIDISNNFKDIRINKYYKGEIK